MVEFQNAFRCHRQRRQREDLPDIAEVHVKSWQEVYVGQVPQGYLDGLNVDARQRKWQEGFAADIKDGLPGLVVARCSGMAVGFISYGRARDGGVPARAKSTPSTC